MKFFNHPLIKENMLEYREYQDKISYATIKQNTLVVLPTGTGKTIIALLTTIRWLEKNPDSRIYFLAPTRPLVNQHYQMFNKFLKTDKTPMSVLTGERRPETRRVFWSRKIIFSTPQLMYNDLIRGYVSITSKDLLIFDEVHKAVGNHAYVKIVKLLITRNIYPRILALTASPGGKEKTLEIMENLNLSNIEIYTHEDPLVSRYFHGYTVKPIFIDLDPIHSHMINLTWKAIEQYIERLNMFLKPYGLSLNKRRLSYTYLTDIRDSILEKIEEDVDQKVLRDIRKIIYEIILLERLLTYLEIYTYPTAKKFLEGIYGSGRTIRKRGLTLYYNKEVREVYHLLLKAEEKQVLNNKTKKMIEILKTSNFKRALIFTSLKENASELFNIIKNSGFNAGILIGQGKGREDLGMKQIQQIKTLDEFNKGVTKVLVATHVGEEGLDISEVDLVIFFDNPVSAIRRIQRMGRTGRKERGKVIFLINKGTREEIKYYVSQKKQRKLLEELRQLKQEIQIKKSSLDSYVNIDESRHEKVRRNIDYKIIVDSREKTSIINLLTSKNIPITIENLEVGDYIIGNNIIERKTIEDLAKSLFDGRIFEQLRALKNVGTKNPILIVEGKKSDYVKYINHKAFLGILYTIMLEFKIPIYFSEDERDTAEFLNYLYMKSLEAGEKTERVRYERKPKSIYEIQKFVLSGIPGIDSKIAERILKRFGNLKNVANATPSKLMEVKGIGKELALRIYRVFNHRENDV